MDSLEALQAALPTCPPGHECCPGSCCQGTELLCISIPCPINVVLLGAINLTISLPCLSTSTMTLAEIHQILGLLISILTFINNLPL